MSPPRLSALRSRHPADHFRQDLAVVIFKAERITSGFVCYLRSIEIRESHSLIAISRKTRVTRARRQIRDLDLMQEQRFAGLVALVIYAQSLIRRENDTPNDCAVDKEHSTSALTRTTVDNRFPTTGSNPGCGRGPAMSMHSKSPITTEYVEFIR